MSEFKELFHLVRHNIVDVSRQLTGVSLEEAYLRHMPDADVLYLAVAGDYFLDMYLYMDKRISVNIARSMTRGYAAGTEAILYTAEFFNILGGRIVSEINRRYKKSARFKPPVLLTEHESKQCEKQMMDLFYRWADGSMKIELQFMNDCVPWEKGSRSYGEKSIGC